MKNLFLTSITAILMTAASASASDFPQQKAINFLKSWPKDLSILNVYGVQSTESGAILYFDGKSPKCSDGVWTATFIKLDNGEWFSTSITDSGGGMGLCGWRNRMVDIGGY